VSKYSVGTAVRLCLMTDGSGSCSPATVVRYPTPDHTNVVRTVNNHQIFVTVPRYFLHEPDEPCFHDSGVTPE